MKKIQVLHVIKTLGLGGAETNLLNLVGAMDPERVETHVAYSWGGEIESRFKENGVQLFKYADSSHKIKSLATAGIIFKLARYIFKNKIDVVHTHVFNAHVWAGVAARLLQRKVVEHVHDFRYIRETEREKGGCNIDQFRYASKIKHLSDAVIVLTEQNKQFILENQFHAPQDVRIIRNGIPLDDSAVPVGGEASARLVISQNRKIFFTPARMSAEKNIDLLFKVIRPVIRACPEAFFLIAGDGPLLETYRKRVLDEKLGSHISFMGFQQNIRRILKHVHAMILPSFLELHPISILEALSEKVPVVISKNVGCNSEVFKNHHDALLLDPRRTKDWAKALITLIHNPTHARRIGENGFKLCQDQFDIRKTATQIQGVYEELIR